MNLPTRCFLAGLLVTVVSANNQAWSAITRLNVPHTFSCNDSRTNISIDISNRMYWTRLGSEDVIIKTDGDYLLADEDGISGMLLTIRNVRPNVSGIYFCTVRNQNGARVGRVVKGLNIAGHIYDDQLDQYKTDIIRGVICAAAVFVLVVGIGLIDRFRYLTDEQKQKRQDRKLQRERRLQQAHNGGVDNLAVDGPDHEEEIPVHKINGSPKIPSEKSTRL